MTRTVLVVCLILLSAIVAFAVTLRFKNDRDRALEERAAAQAEVARLEGMEPVIITKEIKGDTITRVVQDPALVAEIERLKEAGLSVTRVESSEGTTDEFTIAGGDPISDSDGTMRCPECAFTVTSKHSCIDASTELGEAFAECSGEVTVTPTRGDPQTKRLQSVRVEVTATPPIRDRRLRMLIGPSMGVIYDQTHQQLGWQAGVEVCPQRTAAASFWGEARWCFQAAHGRAGASRRTTLSASWLFGGGRRR